MKEIEVKFAPFCAHCKKLIESSKHFIGWLEKDSKLSPEEQLLQSIFGEKEKEENIFYRIRGVHFKCCKAWQKKVKKRIDILLNMNEYKSLEILKKK